MKRWLRILAPVLILTILASSRVNAQAPKDGPMAKLTHSLAILHEQYTSQLAQRSAVPFSSNDPLVKLVDDRVVIDAIASGDVEALKSDLAFLGMEEAVAFGRMVSGQVPISRISAVTALNSLRFAQPAAAITNAGVVTSQGDQAMRANAARTKFGVDGTGINVGALSDSFNCLGGASADVANGDLSPVTVIQEISSCTGATDEARALLQIVHDVAPGASLLFATADGGQANFANNIIALKNNGARVIVDDVIYFAEPMFQDGIIAQAVNNVVGGGAAYFSAAGNYARQGYQSAFRAGDSFAARAIPSAPGAPPFFGGTAHNFNSNGGKDHFQSITIPALTTVVFSFQWDSPFFSACPPSRSDCQGTQNDLDIYILNSSATQVLAGSVFDNIGNDAVEIAAFTNRGAMPVTVNLMIVKFSGADPGLIKYVYFGFGSATINEFNTNSGTIFGHPNAVGAEAVGAARYSNTPAFGVSPPQLESFSSSGATPILFDLAGNRLATPDPRVVKPEIVAPDGVGTTFFGSSDTDGDGFPNFFGTSAAAPHAAGVAALLLQLHPTLAPPRIYRALERTAIDIGTPGFDNNSGFGLIQADAALAVALSQTLIDFDGDRETDAGVYQQSTGNWFVERSSSGFLIPALNFGGPGFTPVAGDYDGDGITDPAVYQSSTGNWFILGSSVGFFNVLNFGGSGFIPVPGDYDVDGKTDVAVYQQSTGNWFAVGSAVGLFTPALNFGGSGYVAVPGDYDGDGKTDAAVYQQSTGDWFVVGSTAGFFTPALNFGGAVYLPVPGDYDGDGETDAAVYQSSTGNWFVVGSTAGFFAPALNFGGSGYIPVPGDYDGDGETDAAVYQSSTGNWFVMGTTAGFFSPAMNFGGSGFVPVTDNPALR
jgi:hypothetical protein